MQFRFTIAIDIERAPHPEEPQPEGANALVETAPDYYPIGFTPNQAEAKDGKKYAAPSTPRT